MRIVREPYPLQIKTDHKQLENLVHFNSLCSIITSDAICTYKIKSTTEIAKQVSSRKGLFTSKLDLKFKEETSKMNIWITALYRAGTWTLWKVDQKYLGSFKMWY
jgi:hypothetical protein